MKHNLDNYVPKGQLEGFPLEIVERMLNCQIEQGNKVDISIFEIYKDASFCQRGFDWIETKKKVRFG